jgi:hypothetical protein
MARLVPRPARGEKLQRNRIEHVNSSVKRCRIAKDRIRQWMQSVRDLVMEVRGARHNFRVRPTFWQSMV